MGTVFDYLKWRGDLSFSQDPFNDIDALILSLLSYLPYKDIVPGIHCKNGISLKDAVSQLSSKLQADDKEFPRIGQTPSAAFDAELLHLFKKAGTCPRFANVQLSKFEENTDYVVSQQFAAVTYLLNNPKREKVMAFRGTDNSLIGWKEDFELTYKEEIPAQESACRYLEKTIGVFSNPFIVCGHSKGGNLAVYAGAHLNAFRQHKLIRVINFDGPGFDFEFIPRSPFTRSEQKVVNYVPEESIIGMLLESVGSVNVISSSAHNILQHNALNWHIESTGFIAGDLSSTAQLLDCSLKTWLKQIPMSERETFVEAIFDILSASEGTVLDPAETWQENIEEIKKIRLKYAKLDADTKALLNKIFSSLTSQTINMVSEAIKEKLLKIF